MRKNWFFFVALAIMVAVAAVVIFGADSTTDEMEANLYVANATPTATPTTEPTATPTPTPTPKATEKVRWTDEYGKTYFASFQVATDISVQERIDAAIMDEYNVYDVVRDGDVVLCNSTYGGISVPQKVKLLRDGNSLLVYAKEGMYGYGQSSSAASDIGFVKQFYCATHESFRKEGTVTRFYLAAEPNNLKGPFTVDDFIVSWVLVKRNDLYTWCLKLCDCSKDNGQGGGSPSGGGTSQTPSGGSEPTATPKPTGENNVMGENNHRVTPRPEQSTSTSTPTSTTVGESSGRPSLSEDWNDRPIEEDTEY